ncbi:hypothetical protein [Labedaea rhizosphaerae]|uniref:Uncharacterized protein n=1 Tax=Labedaea rhizosphaerae TaxID=598644 RepID=A0A4R6RUD4_LABRH|nr:hypothetical protein [Labedaea rhizosphaerae]TDP90522.1 hypothetical protein EV186_11062 [Labedaea rhizosphaerae]
MTTPKSPTKQADTIVDKTGAELEEARAAHAALADQKLEAQTAATDLANEADGLETRLRDGDRSITYKDITEAQEKAKHAALVAVSFEREIEEAETTEKRASLAHAAARLTALEDRFGAALGKAAKPIVDNLAGLLQGLQETYDEYRLCVSLAAGGNGTPHPQGLNRTLHYNPSDGYVPALELPDAGDLIAELIATGVERAFGSLQDDRAGATSTLRALSTTPKIPNHPAVEAARKTHADTHNSAVHWVKAVQA